MGTTHDYTNAKRSWSHDITVHFIRNEGKTLNASGWGPGLCRGDYVLLNRNPRETTRYQIKHIDYKEDPANAWVALLVFAPRPDA